ncbi:MAG: hypothetical protein WC637_15715 [Victivallales bacterium]|jgi:hypothetical protein
MSKKATAERKPDKSEEETNPCLNIMPVYQGGEPICGICACSAIYRYLKVPVQNFRERLGADRLVVPKFQFPLKDAISDCLKGTGTWAASVCEVLWEDGFDYETTADFEEFVGMIPILLDMGYPSLVVVEGLSHWVVVSGIDDDIICIVDSRYPKKKPFWKPIETFQRSFNCAIMITGHGIPRKPRARDYTRNYLAGLKMLAIATGKKMIITKRSLKIEKKKNC